MNTQFNLEQYEEAEILANKLRKKIDHVDRCEIIDNVTDCAILKLIILSLTRENR